MFKAKMYNIKRVNDMYTNCENCGLRFEIEPGFFFGAMFVSYAFSVGVFLMNFVVLTVFFNSPDIWVYIVSVLITSLLLYPVIFRYSRIIFLYLFGGVKFDRSKS